MATEREILTLHRYFIWANRMRIHFEKSIQNKKPDPNSIMIEPYMYYWYAGLYVVIEGWKELKLKDEKVDSLIDSPNVNLLKRFRHGVFHFQKRYYDERFLEFIRDGIKCVEWISTLNEELGRYFLTRNK